MPSEPVFEDPEELESKGMQKLRENSIKDGLRLILRAARGYEKQGTKDKAAALYKYLGYFLLRKTGNLEKAKPPLLKSAYLYIDMIESELTKPSVNLDRLEEYCLNVLDVFMSVKDTKNIRKYAEEFASIFRDIADTHYDRGNIEMAVQAYESSHIYYKIVNSVEEYKQTAEILINLHGQLAEKKLEENNFGEAAIEFYKVAKYTRVIFGYDIHFIEMMDTAAKNFEKASKISYSQGDLDGTTSYLVRSQYAYLLAKNFNRAKLIGMNTIRMLYQIIGSYRSKGLDRDVSRKLIELSEALIGIGKFEKALEAYKSAMDTSSSLEYRIKIRLAILKKIAANRDANDILDNVDMVEYYVEKGKYERALQILEKSLRREEIGSLIKGIHEAEGVY